MLPGQALYSAFGHTAIRITDPDLGIDVTYNYGTFDFDAPDFYVTFARGLLDYRLSRASFEAVLDHYQELRRPILEQALRLSPDQVQALFNFLETNHLPENRYYRYDFFFDNCSTRPLDALEQVLGDRLTLSAPPDPNQSFRQLIDPYLVRMLWADFGIDLALGTPTDRSATAREANFLPMYLMETLDQASIRTDGTTLSLVARTDTLFWVDPPTSPVIPWPHLLFWTLFAAGLWLTIRQKNTHALSKLDGLLFFVLGLAGCLLVFLWFGTEHRATPHNWNLLWAWPMHLIAAVFIWKQSRPRFLQGYLLLTAVVILITLLGWFFWPQDLHSAVIPILLLIMVRCIGGVRGVAVVLSRQATVLRPKAGARTIRIDGAPFL
jgi:hypothetical protein